MTRLWPFYASLLVVTFGLNWFWEMLQMPAYAEMAGRTWSETLIPCTLASLGDVAMTFAIYGVGALASRRLSWGTENRWHIYGAAALLGGACAAAYEWYALSSGRWSYSPAMPIVPVIEVGLWPLLQLTLLVPAAVAGAGWCVRRVQAD